jgi:ApaG protein
MPADALELIPVSDATTAGVRVEVIARHSREESKPALSQWVFQYTIRITNLGPDPVQLVSRHWRITDASGVTREVKGPGVVGQQPWLESGQSFQYSSWCPLPTETGQMHGTYQMLRPDGSGFDAVIAPFGLRAKVTLI